MATVTTPPVIETLANLLARLGVPPSFFSWRHFPDRRLPRQPIPAVVPDLAVKVLSESNTEPEMANKLQEYFTAGVPLVW
jgi:Uma2 family endonuclease